MRIEDRRPETAHADIPRMKMLVLQDVGAALVGQAGADAIGALRMFRPVSPGNQARLVKIGRVAVKTAVLKDHAVAVAKHNAAARKPEGQEQSVHRGAGYPEQTAHPVAPLGQFGLFAAPVGARIIRAQPMQAVGAGPGCGNQRSGGLRILFHRRDDAAHLPKLLRIE